MSNMNTTIPTMTSDFSIIELLLAIFALLAMLPVFIIYFYILIAMITNFIMVIDL